jgi:hypothetical protein
MTTQSHTPREENETFVGAWELTYIDIRPAIGSMDTEDEDLLHELRHARLLWFAAQTANDLKAVQEIYRRLYSQAKCTSSADVASEPCSTSRDTAAERLALLLLQSGQVQEADDILNQLGFTCRLAKDVFLAQGTTTVVGSPALGGLFEAWDHFFPPNLLSILQDTFCPVDAPYWKDHNYQVEPPSPYFSYAIPLKDLNKDCFIGQVIQQLHKQIVAWKPAVEHATYCELWAHNRPIPTGHQLHYDTDNEGHENIRHPLVTAIVYLNDGEVGPTLITNQRLVGGRPADRGWLAMAKSNRVVLMEGRVLHSVVPGRVPSSQRRVTLMLAFWKRIRVRDEATPGAARPMPTTTNAEWTQALVQPVQQPEQQESTATPAPCLALSHVYEQVPDGKPWTRQMGLPTYDEVFQGV